MSEPEKQENTGRWKPGQSGNPNGRPRKPEVEQLREALDQAQAKHNKSFLQHFIERAYTNDNVAIALAKKILPDQLQGEGFASSSVAVFINKSDNERIKSTRSTI